LCAVLAAALLRAPSTRRDRLLLLTGLLAIVLALAAPGWRTVRNAEVRDYTWAHYRLGAAFFGDVGYAGLYGAMLAADAAGHWSAHGPVPITAVRDLQSYAIGPARAGPEVDGLGAEVAFFQPRLDAPGWRSFFRDKGYNGTPAWWATSGQVVASVPLTPRWLAAVGLLDLALLAAALAALGWTFGPLAGVLAGAWMALFYGATGSLVGGPMQLDFAVCVVLAVCALARGRPGLGGGLLGAAAALRVFPLLLLAGPILAAAARWHEVARIPPSWRRFVGGALVGLLVLVGLGAASPRGPGAWAELSEKLDTHAAWHHLGDKRVGLAPLVAWVPQGDRSDREARQERTAQWPERAPIHRALAGFLAACWIVALVAGVKRRPGGVRRPGDEAPELVPLVLLGLALVFVVVPLSRYYVLLPALFLALPRPGVAGRWIAAGLFGAMAVVHAADAAGLPDATVYAVANLGWLVQWVAVLRRWTRGSPWISSTR